MQLENTATMRHVRLALEDNCTSCTRHPNLTKDGGAHSFAHAPNCHNQPGLERGLWDVRGTNAALHADGKELTKEQMCNKLAKQPDFAAVLTLLQDLCLELGIEMGYCAKFHCELMERLRKER